MSAPTSCRADKRSGGEPGADPGAQARHELDVAGTHPADRIKRQEREQARPRHRRASSRRSGLPPLHECEDQTPSQEMVGQPVGHSQRAAVNDGRFDEDERHQPDNFPRDGSMKSSSKMTKGEASGSSFASPHRRKWMES